MSRGLRQKIDGSWFFWSGLVLVWVGFSPGWSQGVAWGLRQDAKDGLEPFGVSGTPLQC